MTTAGSPSGVDVSALMRAEAIENTGGVDAVQSVPIDLIPAFVDSAQALGGIDSRSVALGDVNGDGDLDIVVANASGEGDRVYINDINDDVSVGVFTDSGQSLGTNDSQSIVLGDVDGDADLGMLLANTGVSNQNRVYINDGAGNFTDSGQSLGVNDSQSVMLGDVDGDADLDAVVGNGGAQGDRVYLGSLSGT